MIPRKYNRHVSTIDSNSYDSNDQSHKQGLDQSQDQVHDQAYNQSFTTHTPSLGKPGSNKTPVNLYDSKRRQLYSQSAYLPQREEQHHRQYHDSKSTTKPNVNDTHTLRNSSLSSIPPTLTPHVMNTESKYLDKENDRLQSLFRKARSQLIVHSSQIQQSNHTDPLQGKSKKSASPTGTGPLFGSYLSKQSKALSSVEPSNHNLDGSASATSDQTKRELLQYLRAKAEQTRLKLMAIEQLERDINAQQEVGNDTIDNDLDDLISPYMSGPTAQLTEHQNHQTDRKRISPIPLSHRRSMPNNLNANTTTSAPRSQQMVPRQRRSVDQLPSSIQQQQNKKPSASISRHKPKQRIPNNSAVPLPVASHGRQSYGASSQVLSPSPGTSPSPPISPISPIIGDGFQEPNRVQSLTSAAFRIHSQSKEHQGWIPVVDSESHGSGSGDKEFISEDSLICEYFNGSEEDLRDVTLSELMDRNLFMLSDNDESNINFPSQTPRISNETTAYLGVTTNDSCIADVTFADRTFQFMSKFESDFDGAQGVPSLFSETIPENDFGNMTFMVHGDPTEAAININYIDGMKASGIQTQSNQQGRSQQPNQLPPINTRKESILDEFLKTLPPSPHSPIKQPQPSTTSKNTPSASVLPMSSGSGRVIPLPAPIITSRDIIEEKSKKLPSNRKRGSLQRNSQFPLSYPISSTSMLEEMPLTSASSSISMPWSSAATPFAYGGLSTKDSPTESSSPESVYSSAKEEFTFEYPPLDNNATKHQTTAKSTRDLRASSSSSSNTSNSISPITSQPRHQLLDMIIIRPPVGAIVTPDKNTYAQTSGESSPQSPPFSATSFASDGTVNSVWSWPFPSSKLYSKANSSVLSLNDQPQRQQKQHDRMKRLRISSEIPSPYGVNIKSRSMSSLVKHRSGWLGFQVLDVRMVSSGQHHIVVITRSNQVYSCWQNSSDDEGEIKQDDQSQSWIEEILGRETKTSVDSSLTQDTTHQPGLVQIHEDLCGKWPSKITKLACSDNATFVLTENGELWGWGFFEDSNGKKQGLFGQKTSSRPIQISESGIKDFACGKNHILLLNSSGDVISWGSNEYGQLGRPLDSQAIFDLSPYFIGNLPSGIIGIGAGKLTSFAWDEEKLYGWGDNTFGQLGRDPISGATARFRQSKLKVATISNASFLGIERRDIVSLPREIPLHWKGKSIRQIQGGERHTVILTLSGLVIAMGNDDFGQLGITSSTPRTIASSTISTTSPSSASSSTSSALPSPTSPTFSETSALSNTGSNSNLLHKKFSELSTTCPKPKTRLFPALVRIGPGIKEIQCGDFHTVTCSDNGQMFMWGRGYDGIVAIHGIQSESQFAHSSNSSVEESMEAVSANSAIISERFLIERSRKVVVISTMDAGVSIALVSNDQ
ncbi:hypothetical protein BGZ76_006804 [Entomortierella beljakovae]|nr:hypothetical protein BGZ76_006804 [Entomortierella beljakovae]